MRIAIIGSRTITDYKHLREGIAESPWLVGTIVSGGADGVDTLAEQFAQNNGIDIETIEPDWDDWSDGHPAKARNTEIIETSDAVVALWDGKSPGTRDSIDKALDSGTPIYVKIPE